MLTFTEVAMCILSFVVGVSLTLVIIYFPREEKDNFTEKYKQQVKKAICSLIDDTSESNKKIIQRIDRIPEEISSIKDRLHMLEIKGKAELELDLLSPALTTAILNIAGAKIPENNKNTGKEEKITVRRGTDGKFQKYKTEGKCN